MSTATKPLSPHGTTARAKGRPAQGVPGCGCAPCRVAENSYDKRRRYLNATGRPRMIPAEPVTRHLDTLFAAGAGWTQLAAITGVSSSTLSKLRRRQQTIIRPAVAARILAIKPGAANPPGRRIPAVGSIRRVHALMAASHSVRSISDAIGIDHTLMCDLLNARSTNISRPIAEQIANAYRQLGGRQGTSVRSRLRAERSGWAPPAAWDDDQIDNPDAQPDWTGFCGTDRGWRLHRDIQQAPCLRCKQAHAEWVAEIRHLPEADRVRAMGAARAAAAQRGFAVAENARELFDQGYDRKRAAERLGISIDYLNMELKQHPVDEQVAA